MESKGKVYQQNSSVKDTIMRLNKVLILLISLSLFSCRSQQTNHEEPSISLVSIGTREYIHSDILNEDREIWVYVPSGFYGMDEQYSNYPVIYLLDGEIHFKATVGIIDQLSNAANANDVSPQMIIVGIVNTNRTRDLTPSKAVIGHDAETKKNTGGANNMIDFIEKELIPFIDRKYPTNNHRTLIGHSFGGLFGLYALINRPELFANYLIIDPSMWYNNEKFSDEVINKLQNQFPQGG